MHKNCGCIFVTHVGAKTGEDTDLLQKVPPDFPGGSSRTIAHVTWKHVTTIQEGVNHICIYFYTKISIYIVNV